MGDIGKAYEAWGRDLREEAALLEALKIITINRKEEIASGETERAKRWAREDRTQRLIKFIKEVRKVMKE